MPLCCRQILLEKGGCANNIGLLANVIIGHTWPFVYIDYRANLSNVVAVILGFAP